MTEYQEIKLRNDIKAIITDSTQSAHSAAERRLYLVEALVNYIISIPLDKK